jgi:alanine racemase
MHTRPVWVEISRQHLTANYRELRGSVEARLRSLGGETQARAAILAVVKADAYGHGMRECARVLSSAGAEWLGVTSVEEGIAARNACPDARILVMSGIWRGEAEAAIAHRLTPVVWEPFHLDLLEAAAAHHGIAPQSVPVHLELDTGMSRQGVSLHGSALAEMLARFDSNSALRLEGIASHFSAPEVLDGADTETQRMRLEAALEQVTARGLRPAWLHTGNSATIVCGDQLRPLYEAAERVGARLMLRPGLSLYGYAPRFAGAGRTVIRAESAAPGLHPVLAWKTRVTSLRTIAAGESAGYNSTFRATRPTRLALLPMGYGDGLNRLLSNRGAVLVLGRRAPIAGRISMDQTIVDVTGIPGVAIGDEVVVLGSQGEVRIGADELADLAGTIPYEVLCAIAHRVPRVMVD